MLKFKRIVPLVTTTLSFGVISSAEALTVISSDPIEPVIDPVMVNFADPIEPVIDPVMVNFGDPMDPIVNKRNNVLSIDNLKVCVSGDLNNCRLDQPVNKNTIARFYNVTFKFGSFTNIFGDPDPNTNPSFSPSCLSAPPTVGTGEGLCFWNNTTEAGYAQMAIDEAINTQAATNPNVTPPPDISALRVPPLGLPFPTPDQDNPAETQYLIPTDFTSIITNKRSDNTRDQQWQSNTDEPNLGKEDLQMYALFEFQAEITIPEIPEPSSAIALILTGVSIVLMKGKKNE